MDEAECKAPLLSKTKPDDVIQTARKSSFTTEDEIIQNNENSLMDHYLPAGKKYHLFISYSNKDYESVKALMTNLEEVYDIKCAFAERDFIAGKTTQQNINDTMQESMKILICLTPNYLESGWCDYEHNIAFVMSREERRNCVIPLMLEPCHSIPQGLRPLSYINANKEPDILGKIMEAFYHNSSPECWVPNVIPVGNLLYHQNNDRVEVNPEIVRQQNGMKLMCISAAKDVPDCILGNVWRFQPLTAGEKRQLHKDKVKVAILLYQKLQHELNTSDFMHHFGVFFHRPQNILIIILSIMSSIAITIAGALLDIIISKSDISLIWCIVVWFVIASLTCLFSLVIKYGIRQKEFLQALLKQKHPRICDETIETMADELMETNIRNLLGDLLHWWNLPNYDQVRHNTFIKKQCLCQIIERQISLPKLPKSEDIVEV